MTEYELQKTYLNEASKLGDYASMSKTYLANKYCDEEEAMWEAEAVGNEYAAKDHEALRSQYLSALMLRYWAKVRKWKESAKSLSYTDGDYVDMLYHSLWVAFYYKAWRYEYKAVVKHGKFIEWELDENGEKIPNNYYYLKDNSAVDKIINRCCLSMKGRKYQQENTDNRKINVNKYSTDSRQQQIGDKALLDCGCYTLDHPISGVEEIINMYLKRDKLVEALIVDSIICSNPFKTKKIKKSVMNYDENKEEKIIIEKKEFNKRELSKYLRELPEEYLMSFCDKYNVDKKKATKTLKALTPNLFGTYINKTLIEIKETPKMLECLL